MDETKQTPEVVENTEEAVVTTVDSDALLQELEAVRAERDKIASDRDNYRAALLTQKRQEVNDEGELDLEAKIAARVKVELENNQRRSLEDKEKQLLKQIADENKKLKETVIALQNKPKKSAIAAGGSDEVEVKSDFFSAEQLALLTNKAKMLGKDPKEFIETTKQNIQRQGK